MISINKGLVIIRCSRMQYMVKKGSMSNYSFDIIDENKTGILEVLFENISYPIEEKELKGKIREACSNITEDEIDKYMENLFQVEILIRLKDETHKSICLITDRENEALICKKLTASGYLVTCLNNNDVGNKIFKGGEEGAELKDEELEELVLDNDYILILSKDFRPNLFYKLNSLSIEMDKKMIISYLDGDEGIIIPILEPKRSGCYNDFEMLRESSFHNLLDYHIMKEKLINGNQSQREYNSLYLEMLINQTILLINNYSRYSYINNYAYSLDFERMVNTKIRMLRFPKCPSCQGDVNLTHPFI